MAIRDIIDLLESHGEWVNRSCTRDRISICLLEKIKMMLLQKNSII